MGNYLQEGTCYICYFKTEINLQIIHFKTYSFLWIFFIVLALANQITQIHMYIERVKRVLYHTHARYSWKQGDIYFSINLLNKNTCPRWKAIQKYLSRILCPEIVIKRLICNVESYAILNSQYSRQKCKIKLIPLTSNHKKYFWEPMTAINYSSYSKQRPWKNSGELITCITRQDP